jgi:hypothetical protein
LCQSTERIDNVVRQSRAIREEQMMDVRIDGGDFFPWRAALELAVVSSVEKIAIDLIDGDPRSIAISATATMPTSGWRSGLLAQNLTTPEQQTAGIWELLFLGRLPSKRVPIFKQSTRIEAMLITAIRHWAMAVRIIGSADSSQEVALKTYATARVRTFKRGAEVRGGADLFPW